MENEIDLITKTLLDFRDRRDWAQFHTAKDLAIAIGVEAAELNELFLWKRENEIFEINSERIKEELADILSYAFLLAEKYKFNVKDIILEKIRQNEVKYPVDKAKGRSSKYNEL